MFEGRVRRRAFIATALASTAVASLPGTVFAAQKSNLRRFAPARPAKNAEHAVIYRNDGEFCAWPYTMGFFETWNPEVILRDDGGSWDLGYPQAIESTRGKVLAAYYFNSSDDSIQADGGVRHLARTIFTPD